MKINAAKIRAPFLPTREEIDAEAANHIANLESRGRLGSLTIHERRVGARKFLVRKKLIDAVNAASSVEELKPVLLAWLLMPEI